MTPALIALLLTWSPVTVDCYGLPEGVDRYEVQVGAWSCPDFASDFPAPCRPAIETGVIWYGSPTRFTGPGTSTPAPGAGYWYSITPVDWVGNREGDCP